MALALGAVDTSDMSVAEERALEIHLLHWDNRGRMVRMLYPSEYRKCLICGMVRPVHYRTCMRCDGWK